MPAVSDLITHHCVVSFTKDQFIRKLVYRFVALRKFIFDCIKQFVFLIVEKLTIDVTKLIVVIIVDTPVHSSALVMKSINGNFSYVSCHAMGSLSDKRNIITFPTITD